MERKLGRLHNSQLINQTLHHSSPVASVASLACRLMSYKSPQGLVCLFSFSSYYSPLAHCSQSCCLFLHSFLYSSFWELNRHSLFFLVNYNSSVEIFTDHIIHSLKVYNPILKHFHHPEETSYPLAASHSPFPLLSPWKILIYFCLCGFAPSGHFIHMKSSNMWPMMGFFHLACF